MNDNPKPKDRRKVGQRRGKSLTNSVTSPKQIEMQQKRAEALDYRKQGYSYPQIAEAMGVSMSSAFEYVDIAIKNITRERAEAVRELEIARINDLLTAFFPTAMGGDAQAAAMCVRLMERLAKIEGYDAPERMELSGPGGGPIVNAIKVSFVIPKSRLNGGNGAKVIEHED